MFKNISKYITTCLIITFVCSIINYLIYSQSIDLDDEMIKWGIRILIYTFLAWGLLTIGFLKQMVHLKQLAFIMPIIAILNLKNHSFFTYFGDEFIKKILLYVGFLIIVIWIFYIIFSSGKTLLGFLIMVNAIITIFIYLPYGIPKFTIWYDHGIYFNWYSDEYYNLNSYRPFTEYNQGIVPFLLDIRTVTSICFLVYMFLVSFFEAYRIKYEDKLANKILENNNPIIQFFEAGVFFVWKVIQRVLFFSKNFFTDFIKNVVKQVTRSKRSYIYTFVLFVAFTIPILIKQLAANIQLYLVNGHVPFPDYVQLSNIGLILLLCLTPLILVTVLKYDLPASARNKVERPYLFLPIYITLFSLGLTSIVSLIVEHAISYYLIIFLLIIGYTVIWGIRNLRKQKQVHP